MIIAPHAPQRTRTWASMATAQWTRALCAGLVMALSAGFAQAQVGPQPFTVTYDILRGGVGAATAEYRLTREGERYRYEAEAKPRTLLRLIVGNRKAKEISEGIIGADGQALPLDYYHDPANEERIERTEFKRSASNPVVIMTYKDKTRTEPLAPDIMDKMALQLNAMHALRAGQTRIDYRIAERRKLRHYPFRVIGTDEIETELGKLSTVKLERLSEGRRTTFWLAPDLGYVIVQAEQQKNDDAIVQLRITGLEGQPFGPAH